MHFEREKEELFKKKKEEEEIEWRVLRERQAVSQNGRKGDTVGFGIL